MNKTVARLIGVSRNTVHHIWRTFGLQPYRTERFKVSADPLFVEKVCDVVGFYLHPPDKALVLCGDEKAQTSAGLDAPLAAVASRASRAPDT
ncbi:MAG: hypothetical protein CV089_17840 [Nitrospira sp. WS110]|nr:hypothetical protein [Nitrospira sp. WS110]